MTWVWSLPANGHVRVTCALHAVSGVVQVHGDRGHVAGQCDGPRHGFLIGALARHAARRDRPGERARVAPVERSLTEGPAARLTAVARGAGVRWGGASR
jgi:hypothetical protein